MNTEATVPDDAAPAPADNRPDKTKQVVEALLLATSEPLPAARIAQLLNTNLRRAAAAAAAAQEETAEGPAVSPERIRRANDSAPDALDETAQRPAVSSGSKPQKADAHSVRKLVDALNAEYAAQGRAFEVVEIAGGFQLLTRPEFKDWVADLHRERRQEKLTPSALETLAIVAYRQPVQRAVVDDIRGVQSGPLLRSLAERGLIKVVGRQNVPGRPILYGTSRIFLEHFGLKSLKDLPRVAELAPP